MDENKLKLLRDIGYTFPNICGRCIHAQISGDGWGTCNRFNYFHKKHKENRNMSINMFGACEDFESKIMIDIDNYRKYLNE